MNNQLPSEQIALIGTTDLDHHGHPNGGVDLTPAIDMQQFEQALALISVGDLATNNTLDAKLIQATTEGGTYKDVTGKAMAQLTEAGDDAHVQVMINLRAIELDINNGYRFLKLETTHVGSGRSDFHGILFGVTPKYLPTNELNNASVVEIVN